DASVGGQQEHGVSGWWRASRRLADVGNRPGFRATNRTAGAGGGVGGMARRRVGSNQRRTSSEMPGRACVGAIAGAVAGVIALAAPRAWGQPTKQPAPPVSPDDAPPPPKAAAPGQVDLRPKFRQGQQTHYVMKTSSKNKTTSPGTPEADSSQTM